MILLERWYYRSGVWIRLALQRRLNRLVVAMLLRAQLTVASWYWRIYDRIQYAENYWDLGPVDDDAVEPWPFALPACRPSAPAALCGACGQIITERAA